MLDFIKNHTVYANKYRTHDEAVIISCYFNPQNSPYRLKAFNIFYDSIKHLNHMIVECIIGNSEPQLPANDNIVRVYTDSLLWHKESLLNKLISELPDRYKYVFWVDADVIFTNKSWLVEGVRKFKNGATILQPFEYCYHLEKDELEPMATRLSHHPPSLQKIFPNRYNKYKWRSFAANCFLNEIGQKSCLDYNDHGHVGFAWGATIDVLKKVPLYDKALIGGADHIIAHASAGQINHNCICKGFADNIDEINSWSTRFLSATEGAIDYVSGDLYHIWHGDINKREYLQRIVEFAPKANSITHRDKNGLYIGNQDSSAYMANYYARREVNDNSFMDSMLMGYLTNNAMIGMAFGGNPAGAMLGDMMNSSESDNITNNENFS